MWVYIEGYKYPYRINEDARVQRYYNGEWLELKPYLGTRTRAVVRMKKKNGKATNEPLVRLMANAFMGGQKPGTCIVHRNGLKLECHLSNLKRLTRAECVRMSHRSRRRAVVKINRDGDVVDVYRSVMDAAARNYVSKSAISARCRRKVKDPYDLDGHNYLFEDDTAAINQQRKKAEK